MPFSRELSADLLSEPGPICECNSTCGAELPVEAWLYAGTLGQAVVLPGHQDAGERVAEFDGFVVAEESDPPARRIVVEVPLTNFGRRRAEALKERILEALEDRDGLWLVGVEARVEGEWR